MRKIRKILSVLMLCFIIFMSEVHLGKVQAASTSNLNVVTDINSMKIGDKIPCRYTAATSGQPGYFSELGTCTATEIPTTGTQTPDGLFYFIKTARGTLVADRNVQTGISWDALNSVNYINGKIAGIPTNLSTFGNTYTGNNPSYTGNPCQGDCTTSSTSANGWTNILLH